MAPRYRATLLLHLLPLGGTAVPWVPPRVVPGKEEATYLGRPTHSWKKEAKAYLPSVLHFGYPPDDPPPPSFEYGYKWVSPVPQAGHPPLPLFRGDPASLPVLVEMLESLDPKVRAVAAAGLARLGEKGVSAIPALCRARLRPWWAKCKELYDDIARRDLDDARAHITRRAAEVRQHAPRKRGTPSPR
jgi:hypothetical protein